jgi:hypothetical protein
MSFDEYVQRWTPEQVAEELRKFEAALGEVPPDA